MTEQSDTEAAEFVLRDSSPLEPASSTAFKPDRRLAAGARRPWRLAALFVVPYLLLMLSWAFANPPGAAPDESDHLVKAMGMATFDIGTDYMPDKPPPGASRQRNASISRVITIPSNMAPGGYSCMAFKPAASAACLPKTPGTSTAPLTWVDPLGSYPPFLYAPMGWVASLAPTPFAAFLLVRVFCALLCSALLLLGAAHLVRALGGRALLGGFVVLTPMAVYSSAIVTANGFEICAAFATTCIVVVALRRPETLREPGTALLLAGVGGTLILSRQLGVVTFGLLMLLLLVRLRPTFFWQLLRARNPMVLISIGVLIACGAAIAWWESGFDHPVRVGSPFSSAALGNFAGPEGYGLLRSGVGLFGWLDTSMPSWFTGIWIVLFVVVIGLAVLIGSPADRRTLLTWLVLLCLVALFTYATVFFPVGAHIQGRHVLAFFTLLPLLSGVIISERLDAFDPDVSRRLFRTVAVVVPVLQFIALYLNARRYAVGFKGKVWFLPGAQWHPVLGWVPWLLLGLIGAALLGRTVHRLGKFEPVNSLEMESANVER